jgi:hypothetical protein
MNNKCVLSWNDSHTIGTSHKLWVWGMKHLIMTGTMPLISSVETGSGARSSPIQWEQGAPFLQAKRPERKANHSYPCNAEDNCIIARCVFVSCSISLSNKFPFKFSVRIISRQCHSSRHPTYFTLPFHLSLHHLLDVHPSSVSLELVK